ncbi:tRNA pseudouridine synthase A [Bifidobacterium panos]|uniref:tRNA pseudouridine synthase A n=1 Tax=Bifidobacterium panos TaxID=2675321 RepID=A0ABX1SWR3_9BIFI|nr:tRNA pseudouridine synthase A [Bifidobacterium sp. DSM 109963]NMN02283.1 pseudouridine synthase [Bifidobacterium sp. DSM 109963]
MGVMRLRIDLGYDGEGFYGWALQPNVRTVQGEVENAIRRILRVPPDDSEDPVRLVVAGRTDTGVHASHQVCHVDVNASTLSRAKGHMRVSAVTALEHRLQRIVPDDIAIHSVSAAPEGFDARFSALERTYVYRIADRGSGVDPRLRGCVLHIDDELDIDAMNQAAAMTIGLHDFGSFATPNPGGTTIREVKRAYWERVPSTPLCAGIAPQAGRVAAKAKAKTKTKAKTKAAAEPTESPESTEATTQSYVVPALESGLVCFTIVADAFARNMVRSLVNACVQIGVGKRDLDWFAGKMEVPEREGSTGPIAPQGLTLEHVAYPPDSQLASRAQSIRAVRTLS